MFNLLNEDYLDKDKLFWDYHTAPFNGKDPFDITKGESSFVKQLLHDPDYMKDSKNLVGIIKQLTPMEYFQECAKIFNSTFNGQVNQIKGDVNTLNKLKEVLFTYKRTFPITYLNYAEKGQEGRHRMYLIGELFGWNKKYPVLIIDWANKEKVIREQEAKEKARREQITYNIEQAINKIISFEFYSVDEIIDELELRLQIRYLAEDIQIKYENNYLFIKVKDIDYKVNIYEFDLKDTPMDYDDLDITIEDLDDLSWVHK